MSSRKSIDGGGTVIGVIANGTHDPNYAYAREVELWLEERGYITTCEEPEMYSSKYLIVLGGDGTMLRAARETAKYNTQILGINLGTLGYLTDAERHDGLEAIEKMLTGDYKRERRIMLESRGNVALNEIMIHRVEPSKLMGFRICVNGDHMDTLRADGIIVSTPTGSTAYNLSAGGPILRPDSEMIVITAVCPHTLYARPWVIPGDDEVSLTPVDASDCHALISLDGDPKFTLEIGETITIRRSEHMATIVKTSRVDFFELLRKKMRRNEG